MKQARCSCCDRQPLCNTVSTLLAAVSLQVWDEKAGLPTGYGAALLAQWATAQGKQ
jgi:hypothetical protein